MESKVCVVIYSANNNVYDRLIITNNVVDDYKKYCQRLEDLSDDKTKEIYKKSNSNCASLKLSRRGLNSYLISAYIYTLKRSSYYRQAALKTLQEFFLSKTNCQDKNIVICIGLKMPRHQTLGYKWNERVTEMALERREVDHAMSWLSTLGGGFSALGETFEYCAEMAGKISVRQLELAIRLGDPLLVARCKLWAALSLLQRGYLKVAKNIVKETYRLSKTEKDVRLENMCKGVWAKLQYTYQMRRLSREF